MSKPPPVPNPVEYTYGPPNTGSTAHSIPHPEPISAVTVHIAGLLVTVFGLSELPPQNETTSVAALWLLHPRLQTQKCMAPFAAHLITEWNTHRRKSKSKKGLIAISFDQRNHGSRLVSPIANEAWRSGNERHALDMFSCYAGTALDTSLLLDYLPGYIFPHNERSLDQNIVLGISLGGHAAWHVVMQDPRFSAAITVIGCPDYARLMSDRARLSKRPSWTKSQGREFLGSHDFPDSLLQSLRKVDPAALIFSGLTRAGVPSGQEHLHLETPGDSEKAILSPLMARHFGNKRILVQSGGADKLVGYAHSKPFLDWLKKSSGKGGWWEGGGLYIEDIVYEDVGHEVPSTMVDDMVRFVNETLESETVVTHGKLGSKI